MKKLVTLLGVLALISSGEKKSSDNAQSSEEATSVEAAKAKRLRLRKRPASNLTPPRSAWIESRHPRPCT